MTYWWLENALDAPENYYKSCKFCPVEDQRTCSDPVCRGRGYGETHEDLKCPGIPPGPVNACTCKRGAR